MLAACGNAGIARSPAAARRPIPARDGDARRAPTLASSATSASAEPPVRASPVVARLPPAPGRPLPPTIVVFDGVACTLDARDLDVWLRFAPHGLPFAEAVGAPASLSFAAHAPLRAQLSLDDGRIRVRGYVDTGGVALHPRRPLWFDGFMVPLPPADLAVVSARPGRLGVEYHRPARGPLAVWPASVRAIARCADVSAQPASTEHWMDFGWFGAESARIAAHRPIALASHARAPAVATLRALRPLAVQVLARRGTRARIAIAEPSDLIIGWVAASALLARGSAGTPGTIGTIGSGTGTGTGQGFGGLVIARCPHPLPLIAARGVHRRTVGEVHAGVSLVLDSKRDGRVEVDPEVRFLALAPGARLLVDAAQLRDCVVRRPPTLEDARVPSAPRLRRRE